MLLSQTGSYALRAVVHLAEGASEAPIRVAEIAEALQAPQNYLSKILHQLARAEILVSERGPRGGFRLARPATEISLADALEPVSPQLFERRCLLGRPECADSHPCPAHERWRRISDPIVSFLTDTTIADLVGGSPPLELTKEG